MDKDSERATVDYLQILDAAMAQPGVAEIMQTLNVAQEPMRIVSQGYYSVQSIQISAGPSSIPFSVPAQR